MSRWSPFLLLLLLPTVGCQSMMPGGGSGAADRLRRLNGRPALVCQNGGTRDIQEYLTGRLSSAEFTFQTVHTGDIFTKFPNEFAVHPHTDRWLVGPVADHHAESVSRVRLHLLAAGDVFERLATIAERRSDVCADHSAAVRRYEQLEPWVRLLTPRPRPPAVWAEA